MGQSKLTSAPHNVSGVGALIESQVLVVRGHRVLLAQQLASLYGVEKKKYDDKFRMVFDAIHELMDEPQTGAYGRSRIGFIKDRKEK
jgi:hypothetical protein